MVQNILYTDMYSEFVQDSSILAALRGLSKKISSQRTLGVKRPSPDDDLSRLLPSFVSLLNRISRLQSEDLQQVRLVVE